MYPDVGEYEKSDLLALEKEVLGIYVSGHPLEEQEECWRKNISAVTTDFQPDEETGFPAVKDGEKEIVGGIITDKKSNIQRITRQWHSSHSKTCRQHGNRCIPARLREKCTDDADRCACLHPGPCFRGG